MMVQVLAGPREYKPSRYHRPPAVKNWYTTIPLSRRGIHDFSQGKLASTHSDGSASIFHLNDDRVDLLHDWEETRLKYDQTYVGLSTSTQCEKFLPLWRTALIVNLCLGRRIFSCTSNGALRSITLAQDEQPPKHELASLPTRLCDWRMASNQKTFAYGGDEIELSVWDTERAFTKPSEDSVVEAKKRKRNDTLLHGEIWRAKNVFNDSPVSMIPLILTFLIRCLMMVLDFDSQCTSRL